MAIETFIDPNIDVGLRITVHRSGGSDNAIVVQVDTEFEPDASDGGPGLRVNVNDGVVFGVRYGARKEDI